MYWRYSAAERVQGFSLTASTLCKNTVNTVRLSYMLSLCDFYWAYIRPETVYWPAFVLKYLNAMTQPTVATES